MSLITLNHNEILAACKRYVEAEYLDVTSTIDGKVIKVELRDEDDGPLAHIRAELTVVTNDCDD